MNIKSLLLGSAAALVAVSGARAADAINVVAEPEPAEYVRVCDTYGTGYFYIPGTETCLRIGGYLRFDVRAGEGPYGGKSATDHLDGTKNDTYKHNARLTLRTWTGTETELGTLSSYTEQRFNHAGDGTSNSLNFAWIQLGGFRVGKDESAFTTFAGYAGGVMADDLVPFGPFDTNLVSYTFDVGNGLSAIMALELGNKESNGIQDFSDVSKLSAGSFAYSDDYRVDSYVPHIVAGLKYAGGWGSATMVGAYDSIHEEYAVKGRVDVNVSEQLSLFAMGAYGSYDDNVAPPKPDYSGSAIEDTTFGKNYYKPWNGHWAIWAGGSYKASDKATINVQASYAEGYREFDMFGEDMNGDYGIAANVNYELVKGFRVIPELTYSNYGVVTKDTVSDSNARKRLEGFGGMMRFQRNF